VGSILNASPETTYVYEPFNINQAGGVCRADFGLWFRYVHVGNEHKYKRALERTLALKYNPFRQIFGIRRPKDIVRFPVDLVAFAKDRRRGSRPIMKDPIAVFSADWLAETFDMDVIAMIRHPAGFAASRKTRGDVHDFSDFLQQSELMEDSLHPFRDEIKQRADNPGTGVEQSALLWKLIYHRVTQYRQNHPEWLYPRLEDMSADPMAFFKTIFDHVGVFFDDEAEQAVREHTGGGRKDVRKVGKFAGRTLKRDSKAAGRSWRRKLTDEELDTVKRITRPVAEQFYTEDEW
jgi:hypothetical protein